jgi:hypothetical protein
MTNKEEAKLYTNGHSALSALTHLSRILYEVYLDAGCGSAFSAAKRRAR